MTKPLGISASDDETTTSENDYPVTRRHVQEELINYHVCLRVLSYVV
jgi:hypothetical protein